MSTEVAPQPIADEPEVESHIYRSVSRLAVVAFVLALFSQLAWLWPAMILGAAVTVVLAWLARRKIRRYRNELTGSWLATTGLALGLFALVGGSLFAYFYASLPVPEGYEPVSFYDLKPTPQDAAKRLPISSFAKELEGKKVFIKGYVHPGVPSMTGNKSFVLVSDMKTCCFGGQPQKPWHMVEVSVQQGPGIDYSYRRRGIGGVFRIRARPGKGPGGIETGYYLLEADHIQ